MNGYSTMIQKYSRIPALVCALSLDRRLAIDIVAENEIEVSFFNRQLYEEFKKNPEVRTICAYFQSRAQTLFQTKW